MPPPPLRGRGTPENPAGRFERLRLCADDLAGDVWADAWPGTAAGGAVVAADGADESRGPASVATEYYVDASRRIITTNDSPDISFEASLNPYRGCEHGCVYCYARPYHEYLGLSAGLDFETKIFVKTRAAELLRAELSRAAWTPKTLALSGVTDPYQPVERQLGLTRACLAVLAEFRNPVSVITKSALVVRDTDLLGALAADGAASVALSITTLDEDLRRVMEPRAAAPGERLKAIARLSAQGVPAGVMIGPVVPGLTDQEIPRILEAAAKAGARFADYVMLRLPHGLGPLFDAWLARHFPDRRQKVLARVREVGGGRLYDSRYGHRQRGHGPYAELVANVFRMATKKCGIGGRPSLSTAAFRVPTATPRLF